MEGREKAREEISWGEGRGNYTEARGSKVAIREFVESFKIRIAESISRQRDPVFRKSSSRSIRVISNREFHPFVFHPPVERRRKA